jgi:hypothetical protein
MTLTDISNSAESSPTAGADTRAARSRTLALLGDAPTPTSCLVRCQITLTEALTLPRDPALQHWRLLVLCTLPTPT